MRDYGDGNYDDLHDIIHQATLNNQEEALKIRKELSEMEGNNRANYQYRGYGWDKEAKLIEGIKEDLIEEIECLLVGAVQLINDEKSN